MITGVAILYKGKMYIMHPPNRHHDVINMIHEETGDTGIRGDKDSLMTAAFFLIGKKVLSTQLNLSR